MNKRFGFLYICIIGFLLSACSKDAAPTTSVGRISIHGLSVADTLSAQVQLEKDSTIVFGWQAMLNDPAKSSHRVKFHTDSTLLTGYTGKYGQAVLLPTSNYLFYRASVTISSGAVLSDSAQLNIVQEASKDLSPYTTYVLPITIQSVDGSANNIAADQVLYLVARTGKATRIGKGAWKIVSVSSSLSAAAYPASNLLDNDTTTLWYSSTSAALPQNVVIDFGSQVTFSGISFSTPYKINSGYPTQVQIELSTDDTIWTNKGTFSGFTGIGTQAINTGISTARYLRYTVLTVVPYLLFYNIVILGDISLMP